MKTLHHMRRIILCLFLSCISYTDICCMWEQPSEQQKKATSLLWIGIAWKNIEKSMTALNEGADVHSNGGQGHTPLHVAARQGFTEIIEPLVARGADLNALTDDGETPLDVAEAHGQHEFAQFLCDVYGTNEEEYAVDEAEELNALMLQNELRMQKLLIGMERAVEEVQHIREEIGGINQRETSVFDREYSAVDRYPVLRRTQAPAIQESRAQEISWPSYYPAEISIEELNADLLKAVELGGVTRIKELIAQGADVNARDILKFTPLILAAKKGNKDVLMAIIDAGADINACSGGRGFTALHCAAFANFVSGVKLLLQAGADVSAQTTDGRSAVDYAIQRNNEDVANILRAVGGRSMNPVSNNYESGAVTYQRPARSYESPRRERRNTHPQSNDSGLFRRTLEKTIDVGGEVAPTVIKTGIKYLPEIIDIFGRIVN